MSRSLFVPWVICGLGALYYCYEYFLRIVPSVMTPELMRTYHLTGAQVGNLSAFYYHAYMPIQIIVGLLLDRYGPRRLLTLACLCCVLGTYLFASGESLVVAQIGRFLVGLGSAFAFVGAAKLATIWLPPERFALVSGIIFCLGMLGAMFGDIILRLLVDSTGWQAAIYGSAVAGLLLAVLLWLVIRDVNPYHTNHHSHHDINLKEIGTGLLQAIKNPQIWLHSLVGFLMYLFLSAFAELWSVPYLEQARELSRVSAASANSLVFLGCATGAPLWGWFSDHIERRRVPIFIGAVGALIAICILLYTDNVPSSMVYILLFSFGFLSSVQILVFALAREVTSIRIAGTTIGLLNMAVMIGGNIFQPVIGKLLDLYWNGTMVEGARVYSSHAYTVALSVLPIAIFISILLTCFIRETYCKIYVEDVH